MRSLLLLGAFVAAEPQDRPSLMAGEVRTEIRVDGRLDESEWKDAPSIADLTMLEPVAGGRPTGATEVRVLASAKESSSP